MVRHKEVERNKIMKQTQQKLLEAAGEEFAREGFSGANVNRIAKQAGFSIGTMYNYFPSKRKLMLAFIDEVGGLHVDFITEQVKQEEEPSQRLEVFFKAGFDFVESHITPARAIFNALNGPDQEFKLRLFQTYQPLFQLLGEDILGKGIEEGQFRQVEPTSTAGLLMLIYLGTGSQFSPEGKLWLDHAQVADFILHSLQRKEIE